MSTTDKRPLKVFLCHAHADRDPVRGLYTRLTKDGVDAWLDKEKLLPGQDWEMEIRKAVREADVVVVCLSKQFNQAGFRQKEVRLALDTAMEKPEGEIFIIPTRLEECDNLESLRKWHWVDLFEEDGYEVLIRALRTRAHKIDATLQAKKSWLPKIPASRSTISQKDTNDKIDQGKSAENKKELPLLFEGASNVIQPTPPKNSQKQNKAIIIALIGFAGTVIAGLLGSPLLEKWFSFAPVPTASVTAELIIQPSEISSPTITLTPSITATLEPIVPITLTLSSTAVNEPTLPITLTNVIKYPFGNLMTAFYDGGSFYILSRGVTTRSVSAFGFERVKNDGSFQNMFMGTRWNQFVDVISPNYCIGIKISSIWLIPLNPVDCEKRVLSNIQLVPTDPAVFWTPQDNGNEFRVLWLNEEIARCEINAGTCDFYVP